MAKKRAKEQRRWMMIARLKKEGNVGRKQEDIT